MVNYEFLELSELRQLLDEKKVSSVELTKYFLERIKNSNLNAFITVTEDMALEQAQKADDFMATSGENPLLCGIPYAANNCWI